MSHLIKCKFFLIACLGSILEIIVLLIQETNRWLLTACWGCFAFFTNYLSCSHGCGSLKGIGWTLSFTLYFCCFIRNVKYLLCISTFDRDNHKLHTVNLLIVCFCNGLILNSSTTRSPQINFFLINVFIYSMPLRGRGHILWLGEVRRSSPCFVNLSVPGGPCFSSSDVFCFAFLSISLLASAFPVSLFPLPPPLLDSYANAWLGQGFCAWTHFLAFMDTLSCIHGHTFLHSWTHFLAFMDTLSCIHGHTFLHSWTHFLAFMDTLSCIHGHTFLHSWTHFLAFMDTLSCIHGHTFLHSWTHFLAFMDTLSCIHGHTFLHSWSGPMTLVVGLLHGAALLSGLPLVLFVSLIGPQQLERTPIEPQL